MDKLSHQHGGDLDAIERTYHIPKKEILDFSGNINPLGFPKKTEKLLSQNISLVSTYPDKNYVALRESIACYTGAAFEHIVVGNGSTELISVFIKSVNAKKTIILGPAYSEYEREVLLTGSEFFYYPLEEKNNFILDFKKLLSVLTPEIGLLVLCNPNNPTGTAITIKQMEELLNHCKKNHIYVMVDETYIEFSDNLEDICSIPLTRRYDNIFVIRGISKFYAAPGLRLGYGICSNTNFLSLLKEKQDPWSVNVLASFAGEKLFQESEFIQQTKNLISTERKIAFEELQTWKNIKTYASSSNFLLLRLLTDKIDSETIFDQLLRKKMLIRNAESFTFLDSSYLRFCILLPEQNKKLLSELKKLIE